MAHSAWWFAGTFVAGAWFGLMLSALFRRFAAHAEPAPQVKIRPRQVGVPGPVLVAKRR